MEYIHSKSFDKIQLIDVLNIDAKIYKKEHQGNFSSVSERFKANEEMFIFAYNDDKQMVGYICFFPISTELVSKILNSNNIYDDNIESHDITQYKYGKIHDIFIISVVVLEEYQGLGIGYNLVKRMFSYLNKLSNNEIKIGKIYASTISYLGYKLLSKYNFKTLKKYNEIESLMSFDFIPFDSTDLYLFIPVNIGKYHYEKEIFEHEFISSLDEICKLEFNSIIKNRLTRTFLGQYEILVSDDKNFVMADAIIQANFYLTKYKEIGVLIIEYPSISLDPTYIHDQDSRGMLKIKFAEKELTLKDFLNEFGIEVLGNSVTLTCNNNKFDEYYRKFLLLSEAYFNYIGSRVISKEITTDATKNIAQYDFADIYVSQRGIVYEINKPTNNYRDRLAISVMIIYIQEILVLQIATILNANKMIVNEFDNSPTPSTKIIEEIINDFGKYILLFDYNFSYVLAKELNDIIYKRFGIDKLLSEYRINVKQLDRIITIRSERINKNYNKRQNYLFKVITVLTLLSSISNFITIFFNQDFSSFKAIIPFVISLSIWVFAIVYLLITWIKSRKSDKNTQAK